MNIKFRNKEVEQSFKRIAMDIENFEMQCSFVRAVRDIYLQKVLNLEPDAYDFAIGFQDLTTAQRIAFAIKPSKK